MKFKTLARLRTERLGVMQTDCLTLSTFSPVLDDLGHPNFHSSTGFFKLNHPYSDERNIWRLIYVTQIMIITELFLWNNRRIIILYNSSTKNAQSALEKRSIVTAFSKALQIDCTPPPLLPCVQAVRQSNQNFLLGRSVHYNTYIQCIWV